jgi:hypothetical protein
VLFDLHTAHDPTAFEDPTYEHPHLPWSLIVHFQDYPKDILTRRDSSDSVKDIWLNNLKEVTFHQHSFSLIDLHSPFWICQEDIQFSYEPDPIFISSCPRS